MDNAKILWRRHVRRHFSAAGWALFTAGALPVLLSLLVSPIITLITLFTEIQPQLPDSPFILWILSFVPVYGVGIPVGILLLRRLPADPAEQNKMSVKNFFLAFLMCFPMMTAGNLAGNLISSIFSGGKAINNIAEIVTKLDPLTILTMVIVAPIAEETIFRKLLIDHTVRFGEANAVVFSALAFGLFHGNLYQVFYAFGIGLIFGYVYVRTRNVRYTMLLHFIINFMGGVIAPLLISLANPEFLEADSSAIMDLMLADPQEAVPALLSLLPLSLYGMLQLGLSIAGLVLLILKRKQIFFMPTQEQVPGGMRLQSIYVNSGVIFFWIFSLAEMVWTLISLSR